MTSSFESQSVSINIENNTAQNRRSTNRVQHVNTLNDVNKKTSYTF
jgi:hypothetical protein